MKYTKEIKHLISLLGGRLNRYLLAGLLLIVAVFIRMLEPKLFQLTIDFVIAASEKVSLASSGNTDEVAMLITRLLPDVNVAGIAAVLISLCVMYLVISLFRGLFMVTASALTAASTEGAIRALRDNLFRKIQAFPMATHAKMKTGEMVQRCTGDVDTVKRFLMEQVVEIMRLGAIFTFAFISIALINLKYALICISLSPILAIGAYIFFRKEGKVWEEHEDEADKLNAIVQDNLNGIRVVQAFANEAFEIDRFKKQNERKFKVGKKHALLHTIYWPTSDILVFGQIIVSLFIGGYMVSTGTISLGQLVACYTYLMMVTFPMRQLGRVVSQSGMALVAIGRIHDILDVEEERYEGDRITEQLKGKIEFENVSFKYSEDGEEVLKDVSFTIHEGQKVAFVGPTGSGKSTIIRLLTRLYEPTSGKIYVDGTEISTLNKHDLRKRIGVVLQKPFLFSTTIADNIAYTSEQKDEEVIHNAASKAEIGHLRDQLKEGYKTVVGEKGVTLSGGQKQRVAMARTLLSQPDILVLDDVTSAVDTETEFRIFKNLKDDLASRTSIVISHRLTSVMGADQILVLENGTIQNQGTHEELVESTGYYKEINKLQLLLDEEIAKV